MAMSDFVSISGVGDIAIGDISEFWLMRKSAIAISILHAPIPDMYLFAPRALILRIDYISLDPNWISQNESEHISSTRDRQIIELIPSTLDGWAGLIVPVVSRVSVIPGLSRDPAESRITESRFLPTQEWQKPQKHITIFTYPSTIDRIDWDSFPSDLTVYVFGSSNIPTFQHSNIRVLDFLPTHEFYALLDTSEFAIIRWEVSLAHMIQWVVPFFWDMYQNIGGWPCEQSEQFLDLIGASPEYRQIHQILNGQKLWKVSYTDMLVALSHTRFASRRIHNLIHTVKKHIDRFHNSI
jgi:hypothetical protein